eukprot:SAG22_NODE_23_length_31399_cov_35.631313_11_plen_141_part_00
MLHSALPQAEEAAVAAVSPSVRAHARARFLAGAVDMVAPARINRVSAPEPLKSASGESTVALDGLGGGAAPAAANAGGGGGGGGGKCFMRLITFLPGEPLAKVSPHPPSMLRRFGESSGPARSRTCCGLGRQLPPLCHAS